MADYIIKTTKNGYFCGWDTFGKMKFIDEKRLAYRMKNAVAQRTLEKLKTKDVCILETV